MPSDLRVVEVIDPGPAMLVQDAGRYGHAAAGVTTSGWADRRSGVLAQRLVGNRDAAAGLEIVLGPATLRLHHACTIAVTGASGPCWAGERPLPWGEAVSLPADTYLRVGTASQGLRFCLAFAGGLTLPTHLGSAATDTLNGLGTAPLTVGDVVTVGAAPASWPSPGCAVPPQDGEPLTLRWRPGPHAVWAAAPSGRAQVGNADRIGVHLHGAEALWRRPGEIAPTPLIRGAVQLPPSGDAVVLGPDAPVTGGYPIIAVVHPADCDRLAQARPGDWVEWVADRSSDAAPDRSARKS